MKNLFFAKKITIKIVAIKNKVLSLQSLIVLSDAIVVSATNLVILSIYLKHKKHTTPTLSVIARPLSIWSGMQSLAGETAPPFSSFSILHFPQKQILLFLFRVNRIGFEAICLPFCISRSLETNFYCSGKLIT